MEAALESFELKKRDFIEIKTATSGLINVTYLCYGKKSWVLQRLNTAVFKRPEDIEHNIKQAQALIEAKAEDEGAVKIQCPVPNKDGELFSVIEGEYWRMMPLLENAVSYDVVETAEQAFEAARQFGLLFSALHGANIERFRSTIPDFHDLSKHSKAFKNALRDSNREGREQLVALQSFEESITVEFESNWKLRLPLRIMHHDTKISNVLFSADGKKGLSPIDLDTLMPGFILSDIGDMVRTNVCSEDENQPDKEKVKAGMSRADEIFRAIIRGYLLSGAGAVLTNEELSSLTFAGPFIVYMQALRFATDYLLYDQYYPVSYDSQNRDRAMNQLYLLECIMERRDEWRRIVIEASGRDIVPW